MSQCTFAHQANEVLFEESCVYLGEPWGLLSKIQQQLAGWRMLPASKDFAWDFLHL